MLDMQHKEELLTLREVAERLKVSVFTVQRFINVGDLEGFKVGRQWRVRSGALERYIIDSIMRNPEDKK